MTKNPLIIVIALLACLVLPMCTGCNGCGKQSADTPADTTAVAASDSVPGDSTIYGTSDEFGMSTFSLIADSTGDTLCVMRTASDGTDGQIWGDLDEGSRYALTTRDGGEAIGVLINLTQLETFVAKDRYKTLNGHLYIDGEEIRLSALCADSLAGTIVNNSQPFILKKQ